MLWSSGLSTHHHLGVDVHTSHEAEPPRQLCAFLPFFLFFFLSCFCFLFFDFFFESGSHFVALGSLDFTMYTRQTAFASAGIK